MKKRFYFGCGKFVCKVKKVVVRGNVSTEKHFSKDIKKKK